MKLSKKLIFFILIIVASACSKDSQSDKVEEENEHDYPVVAGRFKANRDELKIFSSRSRTSITRDNSFIIDGWSFRGNPFIYLRINEFEGEGTYQMIYDGSSEPNVWGEYVTPRKEGTERRDNYFIFK